MQVNLLNNNYNNNSAQKTNVNAPSFKHMYQIDLVLDGKKLVCNPNDAPEVVAKTKKTIREIFNTMANAVFNKSKSETAEDKDLVSKVQRFYSWFDKDFSYLRKDGLQKPWLFLRMDFIGNQPYGFSLAHAKGLNRMGFGVRKADDALKAAKAEFEKGICAEEKVKDAETKLEQKKRTYYRKLYNEVYEWNEIASNEKKQKFILSAQTDKKGKYKIVGMKRAEYVDIRAINQKPKPLKFNVVQTDLFENLGKKTGVA